MSVCLGGYSGIMSHSDDRVESKPDNFSFSIKLGGCENILEHRIIIFKMLDRLAKWPELTKNVICNLFVVFNLC